MEIAFDALARRAAERYASVSIMAKNFARTKAVADPVYQHALQLLPPRGTVVDIGCGQGIMLALLDEASRFENLVGIEMRPRMARIAREALGSRVQIVEGDARLFPFENCTAALLFDVLQAMPRADQEELLAVIARALHPDGVILVREADAAAGWRFRLVSAGNQIKARCIGAWNSGRHYRSQAEWLDCFSRLGLEAEICETRSRNPLGNVLFRVRRRR